MVSRPVDPEWASIDPGTIGDENTTILFGGKVFKSVEHERRAAAKPPRSWVTWLGLACSAIPWLLVFAAIGRESDRRRELEAMVHELEHDIATLADAVVYMQATDEAIRCRLLTIENQH